MFGKKRKTGWRKIYSQAITIAENLGNKINETTSFYSDRTLSINCQTDGRIFIHTKSLVFSTKNTPLGISLDAFIYDPFWIKYLGELAETAEEIKDASEPQT